MLKNKSSFCFCSWPWLQCSVSCHHGLAHGDSCHSWPWLQSSVSSHHGLAHGDSCCSWPWLQSSVSCHHGLAHGDSCCSWPWLQSSVSCHHGLAHGDSCCRRPWLQSTDSVHTSTVWSTAKFPQAALAAVHWQCSHKHSLVYSQVPTGGFGCSPLTVFTQAQFGLQPSSHRRLWLQSTDGVHTSTVWSTAKLP